MFSCIRTEYLSEPLQSSNNPPQSTLQSSSSPASTFAFLVHSQNTVKNTLPPDVDNESMARQKRRRTSLEDQAILEAEFERDSRPDKTARKVIADRVKGMGDKEVQIWFQNRRQNIRRRSRPLLPHEVTLLASLDSQQSQSDCHEEADPSQTSLHSHSALHAEQAQQETDSDELGNSSQGPAASADFKNALLSGQPSPPIAKPTTSKIRATDDDRRRRSLKRSLSGKRLSMTSEGGARLLNDEESSPSPPRPIPQTRTSNSTHTSAPDAERAGGLFSRLKRASSGRSRDSRAWEFCCDSKAGGELALRAEQERSGSAAAAIELIRTNSRARVAKGGNKSSLPTSQVQTSERPQRPSLERSKTSMARLETERPSTFELHEDPAEESRPSPLSSRFHKSPTGESDKENHRDRSHTQIPANRRVLGEKNATVARPSKPTLKASRSAPSNAAPSGQAGKAARRNRLQRHAPSVGNSKENLNPEDDDEIARFMSDDKKQSNMSLEDEQDMDAIQGLLSLSKGS